MIRFRRFLIEERGYSLVEVMASIIILAIAIIPMVGMFDMGLNSATRGSNYDKARSLANLKMEEAKSLSFNEVENNFPEGIGTPSDADTLFTVPDPEDTEEPIQPDPEFANFQYNIKKHYMEEPPRGSVDDPIDPSGEADFVTSDDPPTGLIRITVTVQWGDGNEYTTLGLVAEE